MILFIIRHGDPVYDPDSLTPLGERQAEAVARRLSVHGLDAVFSSPMFRARETARPTCEMLHLNCNIEDWCSEDSAWRQMSHEFSSGRRGWAWVGQEVFFRTHPEFCGDDWYKAPCFSDIDALGGYQRIQVSSDEFLSRLGYDRDGGIYRFQKPKYERVAVFCHEGFGSMWISHLLNVSPVQYWSTMAMSHTGVTIFDFREYEPGIAVPRMLAYSDLGHIMADRLPLKHTNSVDI